jgi:hypothetical protein
VKKYIVAAALLITLAILLLLPAREPQRPAQPLTGLPWQIERLPDGYTKVFGITPGQSTLADAVGQLGNDLQLAIIAAPGESGDLEMYYGHYSAGVISGKLILVADIAPDTLTHMLERATREAGTRRFLLHPDDLPPSLQAPVRRIIFLPAINLDEEIAHNRFGIPDETLEDAGQVTHLLYPDLGLDFALDPNGRETLRYVAPREFGRLRSELKQ